MFLVLAFCVIISLVLVVDPEDTVRVLFFQEGHVESVAFDPSFRDSLRLCMTFAFIYICFESLRWVFSGLLVAAGDTFFLLLAGSLSVWVFLLAPIYGLVVLQNLGVEVAWGITMLYAALFFGVYWVRFHRGKWQKIDLIDKEEYTKEDRPSEQLPAISPDPTE
jgi:Na+-driven multidrug efflux pump